MIGKYVIKRIRKYALGIEEVRRRIEKYALKGKFVIKRIRTYVFWK
jgi:hypothetical protein